MNQVMEYRDRPPSEQLVDLHVYVMPPDLWREKLKSAVNEVITEMVSAGFIRVHPQQKIYELRNEIEIQLGLDVIPREFVFLKSVGRCLTQVRAKQEVELKVKSFIPPQAYLPEIFLLEATPEVRALMQNETPRTITTENSINRHSSQRSSYNERYGPQGHPYSSSHNRDSGYGHSYNDPKDPYRSHNRSRNSYENERNGAYLSQGALSSHATQTQTDKPNFLAGRVSLDRSNTPSPSSTNTHLTNQSSPLPPIGSHNSANPVQDNRSDSGQGDDSPRDGIEIDNLDKNSNNHNTKTSTPPQPGDSQSEIKASQTESKHGQLHNDNKNVNTEHKNMLVNGQSNGDQDHESGLVNSQVNEPNKTDHQLSDPQRLATHIESALPARESSRRSMRNEGEEYLPPLSATPPINADGDGRTVSGKNVQRQHKTSTSSDPRSANTNTTNGDSGIVEFTPDDNERERTQDSLDRRKPASGGPQNQDNDRWENDDEKTQRLRAEDERKVRENDMQGWGAEERRRLESNQRRREQQEKDEGHSEDSPSLSRFPSPPPLTLESLDSTAGEAQEGRIQEKEKLLAELEAAREERKEVERKREELVKKAKQLQHKTTNRRNAARDVWKKKYFDEKKKTPPLEEHCNRLRNEIEVLHRRLMSQLEGGSRDQAKKGKAGQSVPSQKNNYKIQATKLQHEIEDLRRRVENAKMKLTAEMKLRNQAETELRALRSELTQKKINVTLTRSQQMAALGSSHEVYASAYNTPR